MTYFENGSGQDGQDHQPAFDPSRNVWEEARNDDLTEDPDMAPDEEWQDEDWDGTTQDSREAKELKRLRLRNRLEVAAGLGDFFSVVAGTVVILVLIALLVSLITWLQANLDQAFRMLQRSF